MFKDFESYFEKNENKVRISVTFIMLFFRTEDDESTINLLKKYPKVFNDVKFIFANSWEEISKSLMRQKGFIQRLINL